MATEVKKADSPAHALHSAAAPEAPEKAVLIEWLSLVADIRSLRAKADALKAAVVKFPPGVYLVGSNAVWVRPNKQVELLRVVQSWPGEVAN